MSTILSTSDFEISPPTSPRTATRTTIALFDPCCIADNFGGIETGAGLGPLSPRTVEYDNANFQQQLSDEELARALSAQYNHDDRGSDSLNHGNSNCRSNCSNNNNRQQSTKSSCFSSDGSSIVKSPAHGDNKSEQKKKNGDVCSNSSNSNITTTSTVNENSIGLNTNHNGPLNRLHASSARVQPHSPSSSSHQRYSVTELVQTLGGHNDKDATSLPPELTRRVLDFRMATIKRREKYGETSQPWGLYGLYSHLSDVRIDLEWAEDAAWRRRHGRPYLSWTDFDAQRQKGHKNRPWFTVFLVFVCSIMLIVEFALNDWKVESMKTNPMVGPSAQALIDSGARVTQLIVNEGQWFRILSPLFLHAGIIHYVVNMLALWFIGGALERDHGICNTMLLFFVPGIGGCILSALFLPQFISVGASGGIFGLVGGCVADIGINWNLLFLGASSSVSPNSAAGVVGPAGATSSSSSAAELEKRKIRRRNISAIAWLVLDVVVNLIIGLTPYVDNFSHLGGFVYGVCCGMSTMDHLAVGFFGMAMTTMEKVQAFCRRFLGLILSVILIIATTAILATSQFSSDENGVQSFQSPCSACRYISCVPFPFWRTENRWWYCDDCDFVTATLYTKDGQFNWIELTCPDAEKEQIPVYRDGFQTQADLQKHLPTYCREYCANTIN